MTHSRDHSDVDRHAGYGWLLICTLGKLFIYTNTNRN